MATIGALLSTTLVQCNHLDSRIVDEWGKFFQRTPEQLLTMAPGDQLLYIAGKELLNRVATTIWSTRSFVDSLMPIPTLIMAH